MKTSASKPRMTAAAQALPSARAFVPRSHDACDGLGPASHDLAHIAVQPALSSPVIQRKKPRVTTYRVGPPQPDERRDRTVARLRARLAERQGGGEAPAPPRAPVAFKGGDFEKRPNQPQRSPAATPPAIHAPDDGRGIASTLHHIVPHNQLKLFARVANEQGHGSALHGVLSTAVDTMMANSPEFAGGVRKQGSLTREQVLAELNRPEGERSPEAVDAINTAFAWMPGNLFQGPDRNLRSEDPDEGFESHASRAVGKKNFKRHQRANQLITQYAANPTPELAETISGLLGPSAARRNPFAYNRDVWETTPKPADLDRDPGSLYRLRGTPELPSEAGVYRQRSAAILVDEAEAQRVQQQNAAALLEYQNRQQQPEDDEPIGFGGIEGFS